MQECFLTLSNFHRRHDFDKLITEFLSLTTEYCTEIQLKLVYIAQITCNDVDLSCIMYLVADILLLPLTITLTS